MLTRNRLEPFKATGDWEKDWPRLNKWLIEFFDALNSPGALTITEATIDSTPIGDDDPSTGVFTVAAVGALIVTTDSSFPTSSTTPTPTAGSGTFTSVSSAIEGVSIGGRFLFTATITITTNGTAATDVRVQMPFNAAEITAIHGRRTGPAALMAFVDTFGVLTITNTDGSYPGADGRVLRMSGNYRKA